MEKLVSTLFDPMFMPVSVALLTGAVAYAASRRLPGVSRLLGVVGSLGTLAYGGAILALWGMELRTVWVAGLAPKVSLVVELVPTTLGMVVVLGSAAFALLIAVYSLRAMAGEHWEGKFHAYLLWTLAGACLVGLAGNLLVLLVGWEIVTIMLFLMVNQGRRNAKGAAAKAYGVLGFADGCLLLAVALLAGLPGGSANWSLSPADGPRGLDVLGAIGYVIYLLILVAALAKAGAVPLHTWIPPVAEDAPTPAVALLPAAVDKLLGIYLLAVLSLRMFKPDAIMQAVMMVVGAVTILAAVLMAMMQHNLKKLLSFHAVSQVGYMVLGLGTGTTIGVIGGLFHMLNNALYKSELFLMSGVVGQAAESDEVDRMGGLARSLPVTFLSSAIAAAAISGVPPFNGFVSKWLIYQGTLGVAPRGLAIALVVIAVFGSALTLASFVKVMYSAFLAEPPKDAAWLREGKRVREHPLLVAPMVALAVACVVLGLAPGLAVHDVFAPAVADATAGAAPEFAGALLRTPVGLWEPSQATVLVLIGIALGLGLRWIATRPAKVRIVRPFLGGEVPSPADARFRVPGTHFYETIQKLPVIGPLLAQGQEGAMDLYYWSGRHGSTLVELLRAQHTGLVSLYVAWCLLGLVVTLAYLLISAGT